MHGVFDARPATLSALRTRVLVAVAPAVRQPGETEHRCAFRRLGQRNADRLVAGGDDTVHIRLGDRWLLIVAQIELAGWVEVGRLLEDLLRDDDVVPAADLL